MCLIISKPKDKILFRKKLKLGWIKNNHQGGYAFSDNGHLFIKKDFRSFRRFWKSYSFDQKKYNNPATLIHFRLSSGSWISEENCHPFPIGKSLAMAHNGSGIVDYQTSECSDTRFFIKYVISPIYKSNKNFYKNQILLDLLSMSINGKSTNSQNIYKEKLNRCCFIDKDGSFFYINKQSGTVIDDCWYSNMKWNIIPVKNYNIKQSTNTNTASNQSYCNYNQTTSNCVDDITVKALYHEGILYMVGDKVKISHGYIDRHLAGRCGKIRKINKNIKRLSGLRNINLWVGITESTSSGNLIERVFPFYFSDVILELPLSKVLSP